MPRRKNNKEQQHSSLSQSEDEQSDGDDGLDPVDREEEIEELVEKITMFKMIHENKCEDGELLSAEVRASSLNEIKSLYNTLGFSISLKEYMIRSLRVR